MTKKTKGMLITKSAESFLKRPPLRQRENCYSIKLCVPLAIQENNGLHRVENTSRQNIYDDEEPYIYACCGNYLLS